MTLTLITAIFISTIASAVGEPSTTVDQQAKPLPKKLAVTNLTQCPDCKGKVSKRAMMCPHCGCSGEAIKQAVYRAAQAAKPKSVVSVVSDSAKGHGVAVKDVDATYVVFDAFLLADSMKLELRDVRDDKMISYTAVQLAEDTGLIRLKVTSDQLVFKSIAKPSSAPAIYLDEQGFRADLKQAVVCLKNADEVCGMIQGGNAFTLHADMKWKAVKPKPLRQQLDLLSRLKSQKASGQNPVMTTAETSIKWLTPYFSKLVTDLTQ